MAEQNMNIYQRLAKIRKQVEVIQRNKSGYGYKYVSEDEILAKISGFMDMPGWEMGRSVTGVNEAMVRRRLKPEPSYIEIFAPHARSEAVGRSFHRVLYDAHLSDYWIQELSCAERLTLPGEEETSAELDEFLNSFKIV